MTFSKSIFPLLVLAISACGALEPKFYPEDQTITSTLFPAAGEKKTDPEFEAKLQSLLSGNTSGTAQITTNKKTLIPDTGKLLIINNLAGVDSSYFEKFRTDIKKRAVNISDIEIITVSSLPNLDTLRLMGARQKAKYVLILNSFSNVYRYHNAWTIPTIFGLGIPYFFLETQTIKLFAKIEYSLIDIQENVILSNESVTTEAESKAILPESGVVQYKLTNNAIAEGVIRLGEKFLERI